MRAGTETEVSEAMNEAAHEQERVVARLEEQLAQKDDEIQRLRSALIALVLMALEQEAK